MRQRYDLVKIFLRRTRWGSRKVENRAKYFGMEVIDRFRLSPFAINSSAAVSYELPLANRPKDSGEFRMRGNGPSYAVL